MLLTVDAVTKESKTFGDKVIWGIKATDGNWYDFHGGFRPSKGQKLNAKIWSVNGKNGKEYMHADLIPEHPAQQAPQQAQQAQQAPQASQAQVSANSQPGASNGKIKWSDWVEIAQAAHDLAVRMEPEPGTGSDAPAARLAFVNTTLIAFSQGKLELPTEAGPVTTDEFDQSEAYKNPDSVLPPGWGETRA